MASLDSAMPLLLHLLQHYHNPAVSTKSAKVVKKTAAPKRTVKKVVEEKLVVQTPKKTKKVVEENQDKPVVEKRKTLKLKLPKTGKPHKVAARKLKDSESDNTSVVLPIEFEEFFAE